ncbi:MAG: ATP-binding cassette domain-containing protein [Methanomassiliicoccales archaeon]|nr:ATP-binding cassette domain-containing protein [Methanomassiliicoccales archaeon]
MSAIIEVRDLVKVYNGSIRAVDGITFEVEEGEIFGFLGPNGAGKTTTISMITTLLGITEGAIKVGGHDVEKEPTEVRKVIGLVPQELTVDDDLTGRENMQLQADLYDVPRELAHERIEELLRLVDLKDAADRFVRTYSGGMRKRLELAEGLIHRPSVLFLDEPTLGLDVQTRAVMWEHIRKLKKESNMTVFLTTHYLEEADSLCDRIGIIDRGKIMALDSPTRLKENLGGDIIEMTVEGEGDFSNLLAQACNGECNPRDGNRYRIKVRNGELQIPRLLRSVTDQGGQVLSVSLTRPNLDQVFLEYTGRSLRDAEQSTVTNRGERMAQARQMARRR